MTDAHWPSLELARWQETRATLHLLTQIVGKTRLALAPPQNHWWHVPLYVSARGLTTSAVPWREHALELEFDLDAFNIRAQFLKRPVEVRESIPFEQDFKHRTYDPEWANSLWRGMGQSRNG